MILSIGMIVKNEEKYLRRCLSALKPLLDAIDSELIIADTGSEDKTVEIAKDFTDNVFYFEWCNDYAKARNSTLEKATGEWYMFIDADEILQTAQPLTEFFQSGEYKYYDNAKIIIRNLKNTDENDLRYADAHPTRLAKRTKELKFHRPIHEVFYSVGKRVKLLDAVFLHYGYITTRKLNKKGAAYIKKILKESEKNPNNINAYLQLTDAYQNINLYKSIFYSLSAVNKCADLSVSFPQAHEQLISTLCKAKDYTKALTAADKYCSSSKEQDAVDINIYNNLINMYFLNGQYNKVISIYDDYKHFRSLVLSKQIILKSGRSLYISDFYYIYNTVTLMMSYTRTGRYNEAQNTLHDIYTYPESAKSNIIIIVIAVFELYKKTRSKQFFMEFIQFADKIKCTTHIDKIINSFLYNTAPCEEYIYDILKMMYDYDKNNKFYQFYNLLYHEKNITPETKMKKYIHNAEFLLPNIYDIAYFIFKYNCPLTDESAVALKTNNKYTERSHFSDLTDVLYKAANTIEDTELIIHLCEQIFVFWENISFEKREHLKKIYYNAVAANITNMINADILDLLKENNYSFLPPVIRFRYLYKQIKDAETNMDYKTEQYMKDIIENIDLPINILRNK